MTHEQLLDKLKADMQLRALSESTQKTYARNVRKFFEFCNERDVKELDVNACRAFLLALIEENRISNVTINLYNSALRFLFLVTMEKPLSYLQLPMTKRAYKLPELLSRDEIHCLINECKNLKHKSWFLLAYGSGLRVSEIAALQIKDIDSKSMRVLVRGGKGKKDRYTILSNQCLISLREYYLQFRPKHPMGWLFPGVYPKGVDSPDHIKIEAIESAFNGVVEEIGIIKNVTMHTLRHCFATYLFEDGVSIYHIKDMLGHTTLRATQRYIHLANTTAGIISPADKR